jgi:uncharacterized protein
MHIPRAMEAEIKKYIDRKEIIAVIGPRQSGKTTLINKILESREKVKKITLDDIEARNLFENNTDAFIELHVKGYKYLFIDEIQYSGKSGKILKYIYDTENIKIFISGSSAPEISIKSLKHLVGRVFIYELLPLSFQEFLEHKDKKLSALLTKGKTAGLEKQFNKLLDEFVTYGGYPEAVLASDEKEKQLILKNIYNTYFLREIREIFGVSEDYKIANLLKALSLQAGNIISYSELAETTGMKSYETKKFLNILEKTYIAKETLNFHTNKRQELKKSPKIYFHDTGLRNTAINNYSKERTDKGALLENFAFTELTKKGIDAKYWRTKTGAEADFVIEKNSAIIPIEIKAALSKPTIGKSLHSFIEKYKPEKAYIYSLNYTGKRKVQECTVYFKKIIEITNI